MIQIKYFASLRETLGKDSEDIEAGAATVAAMVEQLRARGGVWADTFNGERPILAAINQEMCSPDAALSDGDELAFFPPVTGG